MSSTTLLGLMHVRTILAAVALVATGAACKPNRNTAPASPDQPNAAPSASAVSVTPSQPPPANACKTAAVALQVLGSGGPIPDDARASSGYLVWHRGVARLLVDIGGGVFLRFAESGARIEDLDAVLLTHLHVDHVGDLPSLLKGGYFIDRKRPLPLLGPTGNQRFPAVDAFAKALLDEDAGAFRYLSGYLDGSNLFPLNAQPLNAASREPVSALKTKAFEVDAVGVHHGMIPAIGYVVTVEGIRIAFGGDQSANNAGFEKLANGVDLLVAHHALPEGARGNVKNLHRIPSEIGALAAATSTRRLVLSHHMKRAIDDLQGGLKAIQSAYTGPVDVASDLDCFVVKD